MKKNILIILVVCLINVLHAQDYKKILKVSGNSGYGQLNFIADSISKFYFGEIVGATGPTKILNIENASGNTIRLKTHCIDSINIDSITIPENASSPAVDISQIIMASVSDRYIQVKFDATDYNKFMVYRWDSNDSIKTFQLLDICNATPYYDYNFQYNISYSYLVVGVGDWGVGSFNGLTKQYRAILHENNYSNIQFSSARYNQTQASCDLSWNKSMDALYYKIYRKAKSDTIKSWQLVADVSSEVYQDPNPSYYNYSEKVDSLTKGLTYCYALTFVHKGGKTKIDTTQIREIYVPIIPVLPDLLSAEFTMAGIVLKWKYDTVTNYTYTLFRDTVENLEAINNYSTPIISNDTLTIIDSKFEISKTYFYYVQVMDSNNIVSKLSEAIKVVVPFIDIPAVPVIDTVYQVSGSDSVKIIWNRAKDAKDYTLFVKDTISSNWSRVYDIDKMDTLAYYAPLHNGKFDFALIAENIAGKSDTSEIVSFNFVPELNVPTNLSVKSLSPKLEFQVNWNKVLAATAYKLYRSNEADGNYELISSLSSTYLTDANNIVNEKVYYYKVSAVDSLGNESEMSAYVSDTMFVLPILNPPSGLALAFDAENDKITITWNPVDGAKGYKLYRNDKSYGTFDPLGTFTDNECIDETFAYSTTYYYKIETINGDDVVGAQSAVVSIEIPVGVWNVTPVLTGFSAVDVSGLDGRKAFNVNWDALSGASYYYVYYSESESGSYSRYYMATMLGGKDYEFEGTACTFEATGEEGTTFYFKIAAFDSKERKSNYSNIKSYTVR